MAQVWSELRPCTKAQEEHLDILVLSDLFLYSSSGERQRKYLIFPKCAGDRKVKLKLYSAWREALQDAVNTTTTAKVSVCVCLSESELIFSAWYSSLVWCSVIFSEILI